MAVWQIGPGAWPNLSTVLAQGAQAFDTVMLLQSGSPHAGADVRLPFPLHFVGEPGAEPVVWQGSGGYSNRLLWLRDVFAAAAGVMWIENLSLAPVGANTGIILSTTSFADGEFVLHFHQCRTSGGPLIAAGDNATTKHRIVLDRCYLHAASYPHMLDFESVDDEVYFRRCEGQSASAFALRSDNLTTADLYKEADYVTAPVPGYGPDYQSFLNPIVAQPGRIAGTEILEPGDSPASTQVLLYRETAYGSERVEHVAWRETTPDPITGAWEFRFLPRADAEGDPQRYAVAINPPGCYGSELLRWYTPEQGES
jgi:hypothetical protein